MMKYLVSINSMVLRAFDQDECDQAEYYRKELISGFKRTNSKWWFKMYTCNIVTANELYEETPNLAWWINFFRHNHPVLREGLVFYFRNTYLAKDGVVMLNAWCRREKAPIVGPLMEFTPGGRGEHFALIARARGELGARSLL
ncbi:MAG: hypothetical protein ACXABY_14645 [Candidatus Thorarchaeota archaeon]|jgi:hypothetical protein